MKAYSISFTITKMETNKQKLATEFPMNYFKNE
jgi:hypothetical protein